MDLLMAARSSKGLIVLTVAFIGAVVLVVFGLSYIIVSPAPIPSSTQQEMTCYSGGHMIVYEVCDETYMGNGYTQCISTDGAKIQSMADCFLTPIDYE